MFSLSKYIFNPPPKIEEYCDEIVEILKSKFGISHEDAFKRVNQKWEHVKKWDNEDDMLYIYIPEQWADVIYYGADNV